MLKGLFSKAYSRLFIVGDNSGWSTDIDAQDLRSNAFKLGVKADVVKRMYLNLPQVVHYTSQFSLLLPDIYKSKNIISVDYFHGKPDQDEKFRKCFGALQKNHEQIGRVRVSNKTMETLLKSSGISPEKVLRIPIGIDLNIFKPRTIADKKLSRLNLDIPEDAVVIGSFQKDGSGWGEGMEPKPIKGPDIFLKVVATLKKEIPDLHVLLSGPSRGYIKKGLEELGIPYHHQFFKDYREIADLYNALDLYIVTSREEGGPKAVLESMAKGVPLVTTAVGQAEDIVIHGENAMMAPVEDVERLTQYALQVIKDQNLKNKLVDNGFKTARENSLESQLPLWQKYFAGLIKSDSPEISIFHEFHKPPFGGGNQFLIALEKEFQKRGKDVGRNQIGSNTKVTLFNSYNFDFGALENLKKKFNPTMVHRVDGPIGTYRGEGVEIDQKIWEMNHKLADKTIFQSQYSLDKHTELGLKFKNPTVIPNASDPTIFNSNNRISPPDSSRKIRLIATSWSDNPKKGGPILSWLDEHLDHTKYELTFVGRTQAEFKNAKVLGAVPSEELAKILREQDIYIAASADDPCSNALIEALSCGLPAVYLKSGGHPELVKDGGVSFTETENLLAAIDQVADNFESYQSKIKVMTLPEVADQYLKVFNI